MENPKDAILPADGVVTIDQFKQLDFRVAQVTACERIPGADKLLRLQISFGEESRQILAGVALYYAPEELIGKQIIVIHNLKPAIIRGLESNGMLLAAKDGDRLAVLTVDRPVDNGSKVS